MAIYLLGTLLIAATVTATPDSAKCSSMLQVQSAREKPARHHTQVLDETVDEDAWSAHSDFIEDLLTSFGKQATNYTGPQKMRGFRSTRALLNDQGMLNFDSSVKSVAIDVGAANNPLIFDLDWDANQIVLAFEPVNADTLAVDFEQRAQEVADRGGCESRWETLCVNQRLVVIPAAMSTKVGHLDLHLSDNPYCNSLNSPPEGLDPELVNHPDKEVKDVMAACWGSLKNAKVKQVPTLTLASILRRIPKDIRIKYLKIDAQGTDFNILLSAAEQMSRIEYVRFEMQVDPLPGRKMVAGIPSYAEMEAKMKEFGFVHEEPTACNFDGGASAFSKAIEEKECVFCRQLPCQEHGVDLGEDPRKQNKVEDA